MKTEDAKQKIEFKKRFFILYLLLFLIFTGCASSPKLPPEPPKYIHHEEKIQPPTSNSLWRDTASLFEDSRARRVNDLVTILVVENITGSGTADTSTGRESSLDAGVTTFFGAPLNFNTSNFFGRGNTISPNVKGSMKSDFKGSGETTREGRLIGTITAKVVEVMPNGNLVLESRKEIVINNEKQVLVMSGMIRPEDISAGNTIQSSMVADARIYFVGDGVIQEKQSPGWLVRILDRVWPF